jgi:hypothetical protein
MQPRHRRLLLVAVIGAITQLHPAAAFATPPEQVPGIIAAQLHRQGVACTTPRNAVQDLNNSTPLETVWTLRCDEASYRVTLVPHLGARITPLCQEDQRETLIGPEGLGEK